MKASVSEAGALWRSAEAGVGGMHFMHVPSVAEIEEVLQRVGFRLEVSVMRSELVQEPLEVEVFSDDCRFWVVQNRSEV